MSGQANLQPKPKIKDHATLLGSLGASKGGSARAKVMTAKERTHQARRAATSRWGNR